MAFVKVFFSFALFAVLYGHAKGNCYEDSDCDLPLQVCCKPRWSGNECAYSCVGKSCNQDTDCGHGKYCCNNICRVSCVGYSCILQSDCSGDTYCCDETCRESCLGHSCILHSDCGGDNEYCCDYACQKGICGLASWIIAVIVLCVLGGVGTIVGIVLCVYCSQRSRSPGLVVTAAPLITMPPTSTAVVADSNVINYPQGPPPVYQPPQPVYQPPQPVYQPPQPVYQPPQPVYQPPQPVYQPPQPVYQPPQPVYQPPKP